MTHTVEVRLGARSYRVLIGSGLLGSLGDLLKNESLPSPCAIITDSNVALLYAGKLQHQLASSGFKPVVITVPAGEKSKSLPQAGDVCDQMIAAGLDRRSFVIALGGGVVGDLAGFVAAIYYRGVPYVQIPTSIVAQVDSAVGGKTGVNTRGGKNLLGSFHQPRLVVADVETLRTLPEREFNEGFAEVIKHAIIRDRNLFDSLVSVDRENLAPLIARNVEIKAAIVAADEYEASGERALLNFGHTIGHAIETAAGYGRFLHGEAISLGIIAACSLSMRIAGLAKNENDLVIQRLEQFKLPTLLPAGISIEAILSALKADKKFLEGRIRFVLTPGIGSAFLTEDVTLNEIRAAVEELRACE
jgi:3-dehydroquinate synthase